MWFYWTELSNSAHAYVQNLSCFCCIVSRCFGGVSQRYEAAVQANSRGLRFRAALHWSDWGLSVWCLTFGPLPWTASIPPLFVFPISSVWTSQGEWTQSYRLSDRLLIYLSLYLNLSFSCPFYLCLQLSILVWGRITNIKINTRLSSGDLRTFHPTLSPFATEPAKF